MELGRQLADTIKHLGYQGSRELQAADFDWMCEDAAIAPFLDWFCININPSNIITFQEMKDFNALKESGEGILEGGQLELALQSTANVEEEELTDENLKSEIAELESELKAARQGKEMLVRQRNKLSVHHTSRRHKLTKLGPIEAVAKQQYKRCLERTHSDNNEMNASLENLWKAFQDLIQLYSLNGNDRSIADVFMTHLTLNEYYQAEERFTQEITKYTKKQFFDGIVGITGQEEASWYQLLDISDPSSLVLKGEKEHVTTSNCKELARLHSLYAISQKHYVKALVEETRIQAACACANHILNSVDQQAYPTKAAELRQRLHDVQSTTVKVYRQATTLAECHLTALIEENASLQQTKVLYGDYNLKISRQDYFTSKQDQVIKQLTLQRARHEFISMSFEVEAAALRHTHCLLTAAKKMLKSDLQNHSARLKLICDPTFQPCTAIRATIDTRDLFATRIHQLLVPSPESEQQLFLTYGSLLDNTKSLANHLSVLQTSLLSTNSDQDSKLATLEHNLHVCEDLVYCGSSIKDGQPSLTAQPISNSISQLGQTLQSLERTILDVMTEYSTKNKLLRADPLLARQRTLYTSFFTDQTELRRTVEDLSIQLQAQMVAQGV